MTTTASIYFNRIRTDFPQAGRDNDSQGFRDNFRNIFNAFSATNADIESLQLNSVTLGGNNDFGFNTIKKATLQSCVTLVRDYSASPTSGNINVDYLEGNYQKYTITGNSVFTVQNWPSSGLAEMTLSIKANNTSSKTINFGGSIESVGSITLPITTSTTSTNFFEIWTDNAGTNIYVTQKGM